MDLTTIGGFLLAVTMICIADTIEGGNPIHLLSLPSIMVVMPSALGASMVATHSHFVSAAFKNVGMAFKKLHIDYEKTIEQIYDFATIARRDGLVKLEAEIPNVQSEFLKKGLDLVVSGVSVDVIRETLDIEMEETEHFWHGVGHFWILAGESAPVMGLIGAVLGLILALSLLDNPPQMAHGIAGAFTATVTGILTAYTLYGPWGHKIIAKSHDIVKEQKIIIEGLVGLVSGDNPKLLRSKLYNYIGGEPAEGEAKH